jgi:hypothetical protein
MATVIITSSADYPHGSFDSHPMTGSTNGYPPRIDPALGAIIEPTDELYDAYPRLAWKLTSAIAAVTPADKSALVNVDLRSGSNATISSMYYLSMAAFILSEYVDRDHPLIKIATLVDYNEFASAVDALPE